MELARKLSLFDFMVRRYTPTTGFFLPRYSPIVAINEETAKKTNCESQVGAS